MISLSPSTSLWALSLGRTGETKRAAAKRPERMSPNVYLLPVLVGEPPDSCDMWHGSNTEQPGCLTQAPPGSLPQRSEQDRSWIAAQFDNSLQACS
jgi:hypothetical protein